MSWRPIESAPKDGSQFLGWHPHGHVDFFRWQNHANVGWRDGFITVFPEGSGPKHWMPLPAPPSTEGGEDGSR